MKPQWVIYATMHNDFVHTVQYVDQFDNERQALKCLLEYRQIYGNDWQLKLIKR